MKLLYHIAIGLIKLGRCLDFVGKLLNSNTKYYAITNLRLPIAQMVPQNFWLEGTWREKDTLSQDDIYLLIVLFMFESSNIRILIHPHGIELQHPFGLSNRQ